MKKEIEAPFIPKTSSKQDTRNIDRVSEVF